MAPFTIQLLPKGGHRPLVVWGAWNVKIAGRPEHSPDNPHEEGSPLCLQKLRMRGWPPTQHWRFTTVCIPTCIPNFFLLAGPAVGKKNDIAGVLPEGQIVVPEGP